jgi:uncharacterized protein YprB with RNaseH-like and TPR domain
MSLEKRLRYLDKAWLQGPGQPAQQEEQQLREHRAAEEQGTRRAGQPGDREQLFSPRFGWEQAGRYTLRRKLPFPCSLAGTGISEYLLPSGYTPADLLFFDTETTGLSGGAGNSIFLMGMAWIEGGDLTVEQLFLRDFPGEVEFLSLLAERLRRHRVFVSYNGRAFDAHVLRTRFLLNRMSFELERQTDLLYWSRRLWRRVLPDCSLATIEREVLGIRRELDVAGFEVPGIYLEYLRSGLPGRLEAVLEHNLQDVRTLAELLVVVNTILCSRDRTDGVGRPGAGQPGAITPGAIAAGANPVAPAAPSLPADRTALGSFFLDRDERWGVELLKQAFSSGDEGAGRALSLYYKRAGAWTEAVDLWKQMVLKRRSLFAAVELAKYFEHRERDFELALEWVQAALTWRLPLQRRMRGELNHRRRRLMEKLTREKR